MKTSINYPLFTASGDEIILRVTSEVTFGAEAHRDQAGRPTECDTPDEVELISASVEDCDWLPIDALPDCVQEEMKDLALDQARINLHEDYYESEPMPFVWLATPTE